MRLLDDTMVIFMLKYVRIRTQVWQVNTHKRWHTSHETVPNMRSLSREHSVLATYGLTHNSNKYLTCVSIGSSVAKHVLHQYEEKPIIKRRTLRKLCNCNCGAPLIEWSFDFHSVIIIYLFFILFSLWLHFVLSIELTAKPFTQSEPEQNRIK